jgi:pimeloyl-ACP methyl ester carboxylesterase
MRDGSRNVLPQPLTFVTAPTLVAWGEEDTWVSKDSESAQRLREELPNAQWVVFPGAGHLPMEEQAQAFNAKLVEFLTQGP